MYPFKKYFLWIIGLFGLVGITIIFTLQGGVDAHGLWQDFLNNLLFCALPYLYFVPFYILSIQYRWLKGIFLLIGVDVCSILFLILNIGMFYEGPFVSRNLAIFVLVFGAIKLMLLQARRHGGLKKGYQKVIFWLLSIGIVTFGAISFLGNGSVVLNEWLGGIFNRGYDEVQEVGASRVHQGIIFTVEEALTHDKEGLVLLSFEKENGEPFQPDTAIENLRIQPKRHSGIGYGYDQALSEDQKKLYYLIDLSVNQPLDGQILTITAQNIGRLERGEIPLALDLQAAYEQMEQLEYNFYEDMDYAQDQTLNIPLTNQLEDFVLDQIILDPKGILRLYTSYPDPYSENNLDTRFKLIDTKENIEVYYQEGTNRWDETTKRRRIKDVFSSLKEEHLKDLKLHLTYEQYTPIIRDEWSITFKLGENSHRKKVKPNQLVTSKKGLQMKVEQVEASALGIRLQGQVLKGSVQDFGYSLKMKDGKILPLVRTGLSVWEDFTFTEHWKANALQEGLIMLGTNQLIQVEDVVSLMIENIEIPLG